MYMYMCTNSKTGYFTKSTSLDTNKTEPIERCEHNTPIASPPMSKDTITKLNCL